MSLSTLPLSEFHQLPSVRRSLLQLFRTKDYWINEEISHISLAHCCTLRRSPLSTVPIFYYDYDYFIINNILFPHHFWNFCVYFRVYGEQWKIVIGVVTFYIHFCQICATFFATLRFKWRIWKEIVKFASSTLKVVNLTFWITRRAMLRIFN